MSNLSLFLCIILGVFCYGFLVIKTVYAGKERWMLPIILLTIACLGIGVFLGEGNREIKAQKQGQIHLTISSTNDLAVEVIRAAP